MKVWELTSSTKLNRSINGLIKRMAFSNKHKNEIVVRELHNVQLFETNTHVFYLLLANSTN